MNTRFLLTGGLLLSLCFLNQPASAEIVLVTHTGTNDPVSEGWTAFVGTSSTTVGAVVDAWEIHDFGNTAGTLRYYTYQLDAAQFASATNDGWEFSATLRLTDPSDALEASVAFDFGVGGGYYRALFGSTAGGNTLVAVMTRNGGTNFIQQVATLPGLDYHDYALRFDGATDQISFWIDGSLVASNFQALVPSSPPPDGLLRFGALSSGDMGKSHWAAAEFAIIPEPSALGLALGGLALLAFLGRWRRRS